MPNIRGGKNYKKSKEKTKFGEDSENIIFIERQPDQMVGRLVKLLGNLNATVYCQDGIQRICKICRSIKKSVRFESGDVVLISLRDCEVPKGDLEKGLRSSRGDILDKYHPQQFNSLKEEEDINPNIFIQFDKINEISLKLAEGDVDGAEALAAEADEDIFDRGESEEVDIDKI